MVTVTGTFPTKNQVKIPKMQKKFNVFPVSASKKGHFTAQGDKLHINEKNCKKRMRLQSPGLRKEPPPIILGTPGPLDWAQKSGLARIWTD